MGALLGPVPPDKSNRRNFIQKLLLFTQEFLFVGLLLSFLQVFQEPFFPGGLNSRLPPLLHFPGPFFLSVPILLLLPDKPVLIFTVSHYLVGVEFAGFLEFTVSAEEIPFLFPVGLDRFLNPQKPALCRRQFPDPNLLDLFAEVQDLFQAELKPFRHGPLSSKNFSFFATYPARVPFLPATGARRLGPHPGASRRHPPWDCYPSRKPQIGRA